MNLIAQSRQKTAVKVTTKQKSYVVTKYLDFVMRNENTSFEYKPVFGSVSPQSLVIQALITPNTSPRVLWFRTRNYRGDKATESESAFRCALCDTV